MKLHHHLLYIAKVKITQCLYALYRQHDFYDANNPWNLTTTPHYIRGFVTPVRQPVATQTACAFPFIGEELGRNVLLWGQFIALIETVMFLFY